MGVEVGAAEARLVAAGLVAPPAGPGVYAFRDSAGGLLYVGTSRDLSTRVRSYFAPDHEATGKVARIVRLARRVEWQPADSVLEALVREARTIRSERPHFNRRLKESGRYAYVRFDPRDPFPRLEPTRRLTGGTWRYLGPFPGGRRLQLAIDRVAEALGLRTCAGALRPDVTGPACLRLDLGQCAGPCVGRISPGAYGRQLTRALGVLEADDPAAARALGATWSGPPVALPAPVRAAVRALAAARARAAVLVVVPAARANGHRLLAVSGGRLLGAASAASRAALRGPFEGLWAALVPPPPLILPTEALDEVRIVTGWLATPEGRASAIDVARLGKEASFGRVLALTAPGRTLGPLFSLRSTGR